MNKLIRFSLNSDLEVKLIKHLFACQKGGVFGTLTSDPSNCKPMSHDYFLAITERTPICADYMASVFCGYI